MKKYISASVLVFILLFSFILPYKVKAEINAAFINADCEYYSEELQAYVDSEGDHRAFTENPETYERDYYTAYPVDRLLVFDGYIYVSSGKEIRKISLKDKTDNLFCSFDGEIKRFSASENGFYALVNGKIYKIGSSGKVGGSFGIGADVSSFWLDGNTKLSYMTDEEYIYTIDLITGQTSEDINFKSDLGDAIPVVTGSTDKGSLKKSGQSMKLNTLQNKFPAGKYWNHVGSSVNNPNGYTSNPCTHHDSGCSYSGGCGCNSFNSAIQCMGYAHKCAYDVTGYYCTGSSGGWKTSYDKTDIYDVKAGDVIRYRNDGHSVYVVAVNGDTVYITDCNWDHQCRIRWDATISKSTLMSSFTNIRIAPYDCGDGYTHGYSSYTVALDAGDGRFDSGKTRVSASVSSDTTVSKFDTPYLEGYDFVGWFTSETGGTQITDDNIHGMGSYSTFYAQYKKKVFTITFDANGGINPPADILYEYGDSFKISTDKPEREGYTFDSWNTAKDGSGEKYATSTTHRKVNASLTLYAKWKVNTYTLTFDPNGGTMTTSERTIRVDFDRPFGELLKATKPGYVLDGWFTEKKGGELITAESKFPKGQNMTVYAHWSIRIIYDANGGENAPASAEKTVNVAYVISSEEPTRKGYTFICWNTKPDGKGIDYKGGARYSADESITLYAKWEPLKYSIKFESTYSTPPSEIIKEYDRNITLPKASSMSKTGYSVVAWVDKVTGESYKPGGTYSRNKDVTFTAKWEANTYTVTFDTLCDDVESYTGKVKYDSTYSCMESVSRAGYTFNGWFTAKSGGIRIDKTDKVTITSDTTLYAHWIANTYTVKFNPNGGEVSTAQMQFVYDSDYENLPVPVKENYVFIGWIDENGTEIRSGDVMKTAGDFTLTAKWTNSCKVIYLNTNGGKCEKEFVFAFYGAKSTDLPEPQRKGFRFLGWSTDGNKENIITNKSLYDNLTSDLLYAVWESEGSTPSAGSGKVAVTFIYDGKSTVNTLDYGEKIIAPVLSSDDEKVFTGWDKEIPEYAVETAEFNAVYCDRVKPAYFVYGGELTETVPCSVKMTKTSDISAPDVPRRNGYTGQWEDISITSEPVIVRAIYTAIVYKCEFIAGGETVSVQYYTIENPLVVEPDVPSKKGYSGKWNGYTLNYGDVTVNALYTAITYHATFKADGKTVAVKDFTVESVSIDEPAVPEKPGYTGEWEKYSIGASDMTINAVYNPKTYYAMFIADGEPVCEIPFTVNTKKLAEPDVPEKEGMYGYWEDYEIGTEDLIINAVYVPCPEVIINGYKSQFKVQYMTIVKYSARVENPLDDCTVNWFVNDKKVAEGKEYTADAAGNDYTVQVKLIDSDGNVISESEIETIKVKKGFFLRILAYFRSLFRKMKVIEQK